MMLVPGLVVGIVIAAPSRSSASVEISRALWTLGLGVAAYAALFVLGASVRRASRGRFVALLLDYLFGGGVSFLALPWPRAHLASLAGGPSVASLTQRASSVALAVLAVVGIGIALLRTPE
jgi:hypothetical protein